MEVLSKYYNICMIIFLIHSDNSIKSVEKNTIFTKE